MMSSVISDPSWCERTQDMSGFVQVETTSQPLDEQLDFYTSSVQCENDDYDMKSENPSPPEYSFGDQADADLEEESNNMFETTSYSELASEVKNWLPSSQEVTNFTAGDYGDFLPRNDSENFLILLPAKEEKNQLPAKNFGSLSVFAFEEPHIKEEYSPKLPEMEVGAEEEVITEDDLSSRIVCDNTFTNNIDFASLWQQSPAPDDFSDSPKPFEDCSSALGYSSMASNFKFSGQEDSQHNWDQQIPVSSSSCLPEAPLKRLDIAAALTAGSLYGDGLPDTPEVLQPVLNPDTDFDLVSFVFDTNNNFSTSSNFRHQVKSKPATEGRRGKSQLTLEELRASQSSEVESVMDINPQPGPSSYTYTTSGHLCERLSPATTTSRPRRESATRFNKRLEEGFLTATFSPSIPSDDEDGSSNSKSKRRRTISTSSRRRLTSDSDQSIGCDTLAKYRERRDKNNLSSQKSRLKRKQAQERLKRELIDLEERNKRLMVKEAKLAATVAKVTCLLCTL